MFAYFLIIGFYVLQYYSKTITCQIQKFQPEITCSSYLQYCFTLEGNEEDYYNLKTIDKRIVQKIFTIPFDNLPTQVKLFQSDSDKIYMKLFCQLYQNIKHYITCINFDTLNYAVSDKQLERTQLELNISSEESCDEITQLQDGSFVVFCFNQLQLKKYFINKLGNTYDLYEYDVSQQIEDQCKRKFQQIKQSQFIIGFYQCTQWKILEINNQTINTILEPKMKEKYQQIQNFTKIDDMQFCYYTSLTFFLLEGYDYLKFNSNQDFSALYPLFQKSQHQILKLIISKKCSHFSLFTYVKDNTLYKQGEQVNEITLGSALHYDQINIISNYLFLQNQTELIIGIDLHLQQKYEILNTSLHYIDQNNLFYQVDKAQNILQFYRYFLFGNFIKPTQKFIYFLIPYDGFAKQQLEMCFQIQYENVKENITTLQSLINKNCENSQLTKMNFLYFSSLQKEFTLQQNKADAFNLSIQDYVKFENQCYSLIKKNKFKKKIKLISMKSPIYFVYQQENLINFFNCQQHQIQLSINTNQYDVFEYYQYYCLIDKLRHTFKIIKFDQGTIKQIQLFTNMEIISGQLIQKELFLYIKDQQRPIIINQKSINFTTQLSKSLYQKDKILFYQELPHLKIIQYPGFFAFELRDEFFCFQIADILLVYSTNWIKENCLIFGIQTKTNSMILYVFNQFEIHQLQNYTLHEYYYSYPLQYKYNNVNLAILTQKNESNFIALFRLTNSLIQLIDIIIIDGTTYFEFFNDSLLYFYKGELRQHFLNQHLVLIQQNMSTQQPFLSHYQLKLTPTYRFENEINLNLFVSNDCLKLQLQNKQVSYKFNKKQNIIIKVSDYFLAPIHNLKIKNNPQVLLKGPLQFVQDISHCLIQQEYCFKELQYYRQIQGILQNYQLNAIIQQDQKIIGFFYESNNNHLKQIFWISDNYFLIVFQILNNNTELHFDLVQCFIEITQSCQQIQEIIINFKDYLFLESIIFQTQHLISLQDGLNRIILLIQEQNLTIIDCSDMELDLKYIQKSQDYYAALSKRDNKLISSLELKIYQINQNGCSTIFSHPLASYILKSIHISIQYEQYQIVQLVSCILNRDVTDIVIFLMLQFGSFMINFQIDFYKNSILNIELIKQIRNPSHGQIFKLIHIDQNLLILRQDNQSALYYYDLQEERMFYDYICSFDYDIKIIQTNTTHFIFSNQSQLHLGRINYEIDLKNINNMNFDFALFAENEVSNAEIFVNVTFQDSNHEFNKTIVILQILNLIFILLILKENNVHNKKAKLQSNQ